MGLVWLLLLLLVVDPAPGSASSGEEDATEVIGALGESATFQLKASPPFEHVVWVKHSTNGDLSTMDCLSPVEPSETDTPFQGYEGHREASGDCRRLQVRDLKRGDAGRYMAHVLRGDGGDPLEEAFYLRVYKRLSEADLILQCLTTGNGSRRLFCSPGHWEEGVTVSWADATTDGGWSYYAVMELSANDLIVTCRVRSPVGEASRTVSVRNICEADPPNARPTRGPSQEDGIHSVQESSLLVGVTVAVVILTKVMVSACVFAKWPCCPRRTTGILELPVHLRLRKREAAQRRSPPSS